MLNKVIVYNNKLEIIHGYAWLLCWSFILFIMFSYKSVKKPYFLYKETICIAFITLLSYPEYPLFLN